MTKRMLLALSLLALLALPAFGIETETATPDDGLVLEGEVLSVRRIERDAHTVAFMVALRLRAVNTGPEPVIVYTEEPWLGGVDVARSEEAAASYDYLYTSSAWASNYGDEHRRELRARLDHAEPPKGVVTVIAPGEAWTSEAEVPVSFPRGRDSSIPVRFPWDVVRQLPPVSLQVTYEMWPINAEAPPSWKPRFGRKLAERWRESGRLHLDKLTSRPIRLDFPPEDRADGEGAPEWGCRVSLAPSDAAVPEQAAEWWYNFPDTPIRYGFDRPGRDLSFCMTVTEPKRKIVAYAIGCLSLDGPRARVLEMGSMRKDRLVPGNVVAYGRIAENFHAFLCKFPGARVAVLAVAFSDGTTWRADADGM